MNPTTTNKKQHTQKPAISPATVLRVSVEFLPHSGWQVDIGRTPVKAFAAAQTRRDNTTPTGYKRARGSSRPPHVFVPVGPVIDAGKQRAMPKLPVNL